VDFTFAVPLLEPVLDPALEPLLEPLDSHPTLSAGSGALLPFEPRADRLLELREPPPPACCCCGAGACSRGAVQSSQARPSGLQLIRVQTVHAQLPSVAAPASPPPLAISDWLASPVLPGRRIAASRAF
jgi:hypothetical protein